MELSPNDTLRGVEQHAVGLAALFVFRDLAAERVWVFLSTPAIFRAALFATAP